MRCEKNGARVLFNADGGPYELWIGDLYRCDIGGEEAVVGWAQQALSMHIDADFSEQLARGYDIEVAA